MGRSTVTDSYGLAVERSMRELSGGVGVADFVFRPANQAKGRAQREIGDFLLWVGDIAAVVSVKSRAPEAGAGEERLQNWLGKNRGCLEADRRRGSHASSNASRRPEVGVRARRPRAVGPRHCKRVRRRRSRRRTDERHRIHAAGDERACTDYRHAGRDWALVHSVLPSTSAVIKYVARRQRVIPACPLGAEPDVLALVVEHEQTGRPIEIPYEALPRDHFERTAAAHPDWFLGGHPDDRFAFIVDAMIEGAADADRTLSETASPEQYMSITEFLDRIPLLQRVSVGRNRACGCFKASRPPATLRRSTPAHLRP
jgi:hypothetical protein